MSPVIDRLDRKQVSRIPSHMLHPGKISPVEKKQVGGGDATMRVRTRVRTWVRTRLSQQYHRTHGFGTMQDTKNIQVHDL